MSESFLHSEKTLASTRASSYDRVTGVTKIINCSCFVHFFVSVNWKDNFDGSPTSPTEFFPVTSIVYRMSGTN